MFLNLETSDFVVHPFDADVHTGGDPFKLESGPLFAGKFPLTNLSNPAFAFANLPGNMVSVLLVQTGSSVQGLRFNGRAKSAEDFGLDLVLTAQAPEGFTISTIEENDILLANNQLEFMRWSIDRDLAGAIAVESGTPGEPGLGPNCILDNATACVSTHGCAWCPSSYTCHAYDKVALSFCDRHACSVAALVDAIKAGEAVIVPPCASNSDPEAAHADTFDTIDQGYSELPGHIRHPPSYRNDEGLHAHAEVSPIHPMIDNELGDDPVALSEPYPAVQVIHANNKIAQGAVYLPPAPSTSAGNMDAGYDEKQSAEVGSPELEQSKMNHVVTHLPEIHLTSPEGDSNEAHQIQLASAQATANTAGVAEQVPYSQDPKFVPPAVNQHSTVSEYAPASTATLAEEDMMNGGRTRHSAVAPDEWVDDAEKRDLTRSVKRVSEGTGFRPKEPLSQKLQPKALPAEPIREAQLNPDALMNQGLGVGGLNNADCTENGGQDGGSSPTLNAAMMNSVNADFPDTLEKQLNLFKDEPKSVEDYMGDSLKEEYLKHNLPQDTRQPEHKRTVDAEHDLAVNTNDDDVLVGKPGHGVTEQPQAQPHVEPVTTPETNRPTIPTFSVPIPDCDETAHNALVPQ